MNYLNNPWVIGWLVLGLVVAALALYRKMISSHEDDIVHVSGESRVVSNQVTVAQRLEKIDVWGKTLTIILVAYGLVLGAWLIYQGWLASARVTD
jgi:hypothetical protein